MKRKLTDLINSRKAISLSLLILQSVEYNFIFFVSPSQYTCNNKLQASRSDPWLNCQSKYVQIFPRTTKRVEQKKKKRKKKKVPVSNEERGSSFINKQDSYITRV